MARLLLSSVVLAAAVPAQVSAEPAKQRTPEQIVCEMTGDCGGDAPDESQKHDVGDLAGFSFTKPGAKVGKAQPKQAAPAPRMARAAPAPRSVAPAPRSGRVSYAAVPAQRREIRSSEVRVGFALGSAQLTPDSRGEIEAFAKALRSPQLASKRFVVEGHTDAIGDRDSNLKLSQERAEAVAAYLRSLGVESSRLDAKGFGFDKPLPGRSAKAAVNRRVQLVPVADTADLASR
jgi:outer membrane protein OmpA-like peptidoglycan-associated protein